MTTVRYWRDGNLHELRVTGHAGFAKDGGPDIVCAAVSMLACTLLRSARESGDVWMGARAHGVPSEGLRVEAVVETVLCGYRMLEEAYPGWVAVEAQGLK